MKTRKQKAKEFFSKNERMLIYSVNGEERVHFPEEIRSWTGEINLIELLKKYHKTLEILEK